MAKPSKLRESKRPPDSRPETLEEAIKALVTTPPLEGKSKKTK